MDFRKFNWKIVEGTDKDLLQFKGRIAKEGVVMDSDTSYLLMRVAGMVIGFVGYMEVAGSIRFKSDWVDPDWRGQGVYAELFKKRMELFDDTQTLTAFCTPMSLPTYIRNGFVKATETKRSNGAVSVYVMRDGK
jgi:GNAT superfamily N-acetyltransferase